MSGKNTQWLIADYHRKFKPWLILLFLSSSLLSKTSAQDKTLFIDFTNGWTAAWEMKQLHRRPNRFSIAGENGNRVLKVFSSSSASGIFRKFEIEPLASGTISWKWKVSTSLEKNNKERTRAGDDYAARVFLLFEPHFFSWRIPNICYVWAGNEAVGSTFKSPHIASVCTIVLQQGNKNSMKWLQEERDFVADYVKCFRKNPRKLSAVAIMADTDDTGGATTAWFDDLRVTVKVRAAR